MRIVHLSDLHLSTEASWHNLESVKDAIHGINPKPNLLVASGDFLDHPDKSLGFLFQKMKHFFLRRPKLKGLMDIKRELEALRDECGKDCHLAVVPGNHDCRNFGLLSWKDHAGAFAQVFTDWKNARWISSNGRNAAVFCMDSNTNDSRVNAARGRVGRDELRRFKTEFARMQNEHGADFAHAFKIVVLHHHPLPIADSEESGYFTKDGFLGLDDAGIVLREMAAKEIDLILHGHKHYAFNARVQVEAGPIKRDLAILAAGSACKPGEHPNSFNLITLETRSVTAELWERTTGDTFFQGRKLPEIQSYGAFRDAAYERFLKDNDTKFVTEATVLSYSILEYGDCDVCLHRHGVKCGPSKTLGELPVKLKCLQGTVTAYNPRKTSSQVNKIQFQPDSEHGDGAVSGAITFDPDLDSQTSPIDFEESYRIYNAYALTREQRARMAVDDGSEEAVALVTNPIGELVITVEFKKEAGMPDSIRPVVYEGNPRVMDADEMRLCASHLHVSKLSRIATLSVSKPLRGLCYGIQWELPAAPPSGAPAYLQGRCEAIRRELLALDSKGAATNPLHSMFGQRRLELANEYGAKEDQLELGLMVFDSEKRALRYVAGVVPLPYWEYRLREGQGIAGRAHKLNALQVYVRRNVREGSDFSAKPPAGFPPPELLVCVPIRYPGVRLDPRRDAGVDGESNDDAHPLLETPVDDVIGVVTLATNDADCDLLKIAELKDSCVELALQFQILFLWQILPALGHEKWIDDWLGQ